MQCSTRARPGRPAQRRFPAHRAQSRTGRDIWANRLRTFRVFQDAYVAELCLLHVLESLPPEAPRLPSDDAGNPALADGLIGTFAVGILAPEALAGVTREGGAQDIRNP
jgi:hypothetical protein